MVRALTVDPQALNFVLNSPVFEKPEESRLFLGDVLGKGWPKTHLALFK
jgi:hypothetical protein